MSTHTAPIWTSTACALAAFCASLTPTLVFGVDDGSCSGAELTWPMLDGLLHGASRAPFQDSGELWFAKYLLPITALGLAWLTLAVSLFAHTRKGHTLGSRLGCAVAAGCAAVAPVAFQLSIASIFIEAFYDG